MRSDEEFQFKNMWIQREADYINSKDQEDWVGCYLDQGTYGMATCRCTGMSTGEQVVTSSQQSSPNDTEGQGE